MSPRARGWLLIGLGFALLIGAGIAYLGPNRVVLTGEQTVAEVTGTLRQRWGVPVRRRRLRTAG